MHSDLAAFGFKPIRTQIGLSLASGKPLNCRTISLEDLKGLDVWVPRASQRCSTFHSCATDAGGPDCELLLNRSGLEDCVPESVRNFLSFEFSCAVS